MPRSFVRSVCLVLISCGVAFGEGDDVDVMEQVRQLDTEAQEVAQQQEAALEKWREARKEATDLERQWKGLLTEMDRIERDQKELAKQIKDQQEAAKKAEAKRAEAMEAAEKAKKEIEEATKRLEESEKEAQEAAQTIEKSAESIKEWEGEIAKLAGMVDPLKEQAEAAGQVSQTREAEVALLRDKADELTQQRQSRHQQIETLLRDSGRWISFTDQIAPIFHQRCVACHNPRNPKGRYNMANFAAILSGGESGESIVAGHADESLLQTMIEDGSMPYEADPLPDDQLQLIRDWIALGARLDGAADPEAPLIRLMPRVTQPDPPESYHAPIPVTAAAIDPEGEYLASSGYHEVLLWNAADGTLARRITNVAQRVYGLAFDPKGKHLAVASGTPGQLGEVKLFDPHTGQLVADLLMAEDAMFDVAFSPDGRRLAACGADGTIAIFDLEEDSPQPMLLEDHSDWVHTIAWSPDGSLLVSASRDKTAKVFDAQTGSLKITFTGHNQSVTVAQFLEDGKQVISGGDDRRLRIWNVSDGKQARDIGGFGGEITALHLLDKGKALSAAADGKLRIHNTQDGKREQETAASADWISTLTLSPDGQTLYLGNHSGQLIRQKLEAKEPEQTWNAVP